MINGFDINGDMINGPGSFFTTPVPEYTWSIVADSRSLIVRRDLRAYRLPRDLRELVCEADPRTYTIPYEQRRLS